jgi:DNA-directed RNA polymerase specialized sigma24 family protein
MHEPFAVELYRRVLRGETAEDLSRELEIPLDRIEQRLRAAEAYLREGVPTRTVGSGTYARQFDTD